jgi:hypothetical protein
LSQDEEEDGRGVGRESFLFGKRVERNLRLLPLFHLTQVSYHDTEPPRGREETMAHLEREGRSLSAERRRRPGG